MIAPPQPRDALAVATLALLTAGCASLSEPQCRGGDWYRIGFDDGTSGAVAARIEAHRTACVEYGISPDVEQYEIGRRDGLVHYCTVHRGFDVGRDGLQYGGACPAGREDEFRRGYALGRRFHRVETELARIDGDLRSYEGQLRAVEPSDPQTDQLRNRVRSQVRDLELERSRLEDELWRLKQEYREL